MNSFECFAIAFFVTSSLDSVFGNFHSHFSALNFCSRFTGEALFGTLQLTWMRFFPHLISIPYAADYTHYTSYAGMLNCDIRTCVDYFLWVRNLANEWIDWKWRDEKHSFFHFNKIKWEKFLLLLVFLSFFLLKKIKQLLSEIYIICYR